jgi:hypothetical protein
MQQQAPLNGGMKWAERESPDRKSPRCSPERAAVILLFDRVQRVRDSSRAERLTLLPHFQCNRTRKENVVLEVDVHVQIRLQNP